MPSPPRQPVPEVLTASSDNPDRSTLDGVLWWIHEALSAESGDDFFRALMTNLCTVYGMKYAFITRCLDQPVTQVRSLAYWWVDHLRDNKAFALAGLPCEDMVRERQVLWIPDQMGQRYPSKMGWAEGYCGLPLMAPDMRTVIGHIAFFSPGRMARNVFDDPLFHLFCARATAELRRLVAEEQAADRLADLSHLARLGELGQITGLIVHELAQPLTTIALAARAAQRLAESAGAGAADAPHPLDTIAEQAERAGRLIRSVRGFARREPAAAAAIDLNPLVLAVIELAELEARRHSVTLRHDLASGLPAVMAVRLEIEQVLLNLVRNATQALAQSPRWPREVVVSTVLESRMDGGPGSLQLRVQVRDNGPGLSAAVRARLFRPFFTTRTDGLGLGLSLCRSLIDKHGGQLQALPATEADGACFSFTLPCEPDRVLAS